MSVQAASLEFRVLGPVEAARGGESVMVLKVGGQF
jgi:hypothetical protein